jgi:hypothetical protein
VVAIGVGRWGRCGLNLKSADVTGRVLGPEDATLVGGQVSPAASMAGLPGTRAWVWVGPPLAARGARMSLSAVGWVPSAVAVMSVPVGVKPSNA